MVVALSIFRPKKKKESWLGTGKLKNNAHDYDVDDTYGETRITIFVLCWVPIVSAASCYLYTFELQILINLLHN